MLGNESFNSRVCLACEDPERYRTQRHYQTIPKEQQTYRAFITHRSSASVRIPYEVHLCDKHYAHFESSPGMLPSALGRTYSQNASKNGADRRNLF